MDSESRAWLEYVVGRCGFESAYAADALAEIDRLQLELHQERMASLRRAHRAVGGAVHHLDGDVTNNDLANIVLVDPAERSTS